MERKFYTNNFERLLREKSDEFRMYPSKRVWHSIYNDLHPGRKWPSIAMSMLLVITLLLIGYLNTNDNSTKKQVAATSVSQHGTSNTENLNAQQLPATANVDQQQTNSVNSIRDINSSEELINNNTRGPVNAALNSQENESAFGDKQDGRFNDNVNPDNNIPVNNNLIEAIDNYIKTDQLLSDVAEMNKQKDSKTVNSVLSTSPDKDQTTTEFNKTTEQYTASSTRLPAVNSKEENKVSAVTENLTTKNNPAITNTKKAVSPEEKAWMEDYALHNKSNRAKWKDRTAMELYATTGIGYRNLSSNVKDEAAATALTAGSATSPDKTVSQKPSLGLEAGFGLSYAFAKNLRLKTGVQLNYTSYAINADQTNHPILTTLLLNDPNGRPYLDAKTSMLSNSSGLQSVRLHNNTYQVSVPVGLAVKLAGSNNLEWYVGASLQPSFIFGGSTHFISSDYSSYVSDPSLLRKWNLNTGFETYLNYKMGAYTLQVGPQYRYQLFSTYSNKYTVNEKLYNMGLKVGLIKGF
jgi:hypothetical protein